MFIYLILLFFKKIGKQNCKINLLNLLQSETVITKYLELLHLQKNNALRIETMFHLKLKDLKNAGMTQVLANYCLNHSKHCLFDSNFITLIDKNILLNKMKSIVFFCLTICKRIFSLKNTKEKNSSNNLNFKNNKIIEKY